MPNQFVFIKKVDGGHIHWCQGCNKCHVIPDNWKFDGDLQRPTFIPSVKHDWGAAGRICHYHLERGTMKFCNDCTHSFRGKNAPLQALPDAWCE